MSLIKISSHTSEIVKNTSGEIKLEWSGKNNRQNNLFECFRELFENLNDDKIKKFSIEINGKHYTIDKNTFYTNYKTLQQKVSSTVQKHYSKSISDPESVTSDSKG